MKKALTGIIVTSLFALGVTAYAATAEVLKGSPVVDGKKDAIYSQTVAIPVEADKLVFAGSTKDWSAAEDPASDARATTYLLYDDSYFYLYGEVTDDDVIKNEESTSPENNPWDQDAMENWIDLGDGVFKASISPVIGYPFATDGDVDPTTFKWATEKTANGYTIELGIPRTGLKKGDTISYVLQLNDFGKDGLIRCYGAQKAGVVEYKLGGSVK